MSGDVVQRVGAWIDDVNSSDPADRPLRWVAHRFHCSASLRHVFNEEHDDEISTQQMAAAMRILWESDHDFDVVIERKDGYRVRWRVLRAGTMDPVEELLPSEKRATELDHK